MIPLTTSTEARSSGVATKNSKRIERSLAATVFRNRAQEGKRRSGWGDERRCLPMSFVVKHGIENNEELAPTGDERGLGVLTVGAQPQIESSDGGISAHSRLPCPIPVAPPLCAASPGSAATPP